MAFRTGADHRGHDCADYRLGGDGRSSSVGLLAERARRIGMALQTPVRDHQAFGDRLFG